MNYGNIILVGGANIHHLYTSAVGCVFTNFGPSSLWPKGEKIGFAYANVSLFAQ